MPSANSRSDPVFNAGTVTVGLSFNKSKRLLDQRAAFLEIERLDREDSANNPLYRELKAGGNKTFNVNPRDSYYGRSYELSCNGGTPSQIFLKLPPLLGADNIGFSEEIETLQEINRLESGDGRGQPRERFRVGHIAQVICRATLYYHGGSSDALLEQFVDGTPLDQETLKFPELNASQALEVWLVLAFTLTNIVRRLHNRGIIHGAIQPRHVILGPQWGRLRKKALTREECRSLMNEVHLVGFGTSALVFDPHRGAVVGGIMARSTYAAPEVKNYKRVEGLFSYPVDLYSVGKTLLMMATRLSLRKERAGFSPGSNGYIEGQASDRLDQRLRKVGSGETVEQLKRSVSELMSEAGWTSETVARVIDKALRKDQADRYLCAEEMLQFILNAATAGMRENLLSALLPKRDIDIALNEIEHRLMGSAPKAAKGRFLLDFFRERLYEAMIWEGLSAGNDHLEVYGSRDVLLNSLCSFMSLLSEGDEYCTRTIPAYWTDDNLGVNGRFLVMNKDLASNGVRVRRLFTVLYDFHELPIDEQMVMLHQHRACEDVWEKLIPKIGSVNAKLQYSVRVQRVPNFQELLKVERRKGFVAYVHFGKRAKPPWRDKYVGFSFMSYGVPYKEFHQEHHRMQITKLRFRVLDPQNEDAVKAFDIASEWKNPDADDTLRSYLRSGRTLQALLAGGDAHPVRPSEHPEVAEH